MSDSFSGASPFTTAMTEHAHLMLTHGIKHPLSVVKMMVVLELADESCKAALRAKAIELGLAPTPAGWTADGAACYRLDDFARTTGEPLPKSLASHGSSTMFTARGGPGLGIHTVLASLVRMAH
jgi:hypothetical protein